MLGSSSPQNQSELTELLKNFIFPVRDFNEYFNEIFAKFEKHRDYIMEQKVITQAIKEFWRFGFIPPSG